jgi:predicted CopG family antitoxin
LPKSKVTTIALCKKNYASLEKFKRSRESFDDVVARLINNQVDVTVEVIMVDNELPQLHTIVFQLGEDTDSLYHWNGKTMLPIKVEQANEIMKQPKPNITFTREEIRRLYDEIVDQQGSDDFNLLPDSKEIFLRINKFLENQPK